MERETFERRYMVAQPNLDESSWRLYGQLGAIAGRTLVEAFDTRTDQLPPDGYGSRATLWANALWAISLDSLAGNDGATVESATPLLTVFIDTRDAAAANGEADVVVEAGPRAGPDTIEAILCNAVIEVTGRTEDGTPLGMGHRTRTIPPRLRRYVLHRDGAVCTIEGCISRYRLQTHHITPWSQGGPTNADNLTTLCWFHHHIVIHGRGYTINPSTPPQRRRLNKPPIHAPPG
jgi:5-methylcytosine-specific restriction endonuclease McrA